MMQLFYRFIYSPGVNRVLRNLNKILYPVLPVSIKIPVSGTITIRNPEGHAVKIKTNQTNYPLFLVFWEGYLNFEYTNIFIRLIKKVDVFYDIGANIGYYSLLAAMERPSIRVVGFEPASGPLSYYQENVGLNHYDNITVEPLALSHQEGEITFYEIKNSKYQYLQHNLAGEGNAGSKTTQRNFVPHPVKTTTLDQYVADAGETMIDLIKLDTEGTEHLILENATSVLSCLQPIVICETLFNMIEAPLEALFSGYGYEFYNHTEQGLVRVNSIRRTQDDGVRNCFFVPQGKRHLIEEFIL